MNMKIQDMLFTGIGVRLVSKVEVLVDNIEFNCWRKRKEHGSVNIGEDGASSFASRMTQGIPAGHHDGSGTVLCITKNGVVRGKSWTRQTLSDAWESTNWEGLNGTPYASGGDITAKQHEENRMRDIHVGNRGSEGPSEEQLVKLRKTIRFEQEASSAASSKKLRVQNLEYPASVETPNRSGSVLVQKSGHVDDDVQISALDAFHEMGGRKSRYIREVLDWYRGEDARDLKRSALNELVENMTRLDVSREKTGKQPEDRDG